SAAAPGLVSALLPSSVGAVADGSGQTGGVSSGTGEAEYVWMGPCEPSRPGSRIAPEPPPGNDRTPVVKMGGGGTAPIRPVNEPAAPLPEASPPKKCGLEAAGEFGAALEAPS